jgi:hypothetical protein
VSNERASVLINFKGQKKNQKFLKERCSFLILVLFINPLNDMAFKFLLNSNAEGYLNI